MEYITDFHIHSKYSRATSPKMDLEHIAKWSEIKGINVVATGDFTHPSWFKILKTKLKEVNTGLYQIKESSVYFIITTELSCIYKKNGQTRKIHLLVFAPNLEVAAKINKTLDKRFNIRSDGRPILGIDVKDLATIIFNISDKAFLVPAHIWTPWFSVFGSKSGFDSITECFEELTPHIHALETGLSANPLMCWQWPELDRFTLISNSDAHSPLNLGREANVFEIKNISYQNIIKTIKTRKGFKYTIEFFPEQGKYHLDGHRNCNIRMSPAETIKHKKICPKCHRPLTIGVVHRVNDLASRIEGIRPKKAIKYKSIIPLMDILSQVLGKGPKTKTVAKQYFKLIKAFKNEFNILLNVNHVELNKIVEPIISKAIINMRKGDVVRHSGYDGFYGKIDILNKKLKK
ncbi:DNA helicase UvrD [Patescibacteria group bacterium]|nr:DNA helicase UvrD [Patescibacteria group bacterium]